MNNIDSISIKALEAHADSLQSKVDLLQAKLDGMEYKTEFLSNVVGTANDGVSNQLSAANNLLVLFSVIIGVLGIWLGIYVTKKKQQIEQLADIVDAKKKAVDAIAQATEDLDKKIHSDLSGLVRKGASPQDGSFNLRQWLRLWHCHREASGAGDGSEHQRRQGGGALPVERHAAGEDVHHGQHGSGLRLQ